MKLAPFLRSVPGLVALSLLLTAALSALVSSGAAPDRLSGTALLALSALLLYGLVPASIVRAVWKEPLSSYGFRLPVVTAKTCSLFVLAFAALALPPFFFHGMEAFRAVYSLTGEPPYAIVLLLGPLSFTLYLAEEFFFRGFLTFALLNRVGRSAFPILAAVFALLHFGKPVLEMAYASGAALLLSVLSLESKSFLPAVLIHFLIGVSFAVAFLVR